MPETMPTAALARRPWVPEACESYIQGLASETARRSADATEAALDALVAENRKIHEIDCVNLNPATNVMNPKAEAMLGAGLGSRPSLGYPGDKYEMGLEAIEKIEVIAAELVAEVFGAKLRRGAGRLRRARQSLRVHGDGKARRPHHRPAGGDRRARHASPRRRRRPLRSRDPRRRRSMPRTTPSISTRLRGAGAEAVARS